MLVLIFKLLQAVRKHCQDKRRFRKLERQFRQDKRRLFRQNGGQHHKQDGRRYRLPQTCIKPVIVKQFKLIIPQQFFKQFIRQRQFLQELRQFLQKFRQFLIFLQEFFKQFFLFV